MYLTEDGVIKLGGFGASIYIKDYNCDNDETMDNILIKTPFWSSPEIVRKQLSITTSTDIWSIGCLTMELIYGHPPYHSLKPINAQNSILQDKMPPIPNKDQLAMKSPLFLDFLTKCFNKNPFKRICAYTLEKHEWLNSITPLISTFDNPLLAQSRSLSYSNPKPSLPKSKPLNTKYQNHNGSHVKSATTSLNGHAFASMLPIMNSNHNPELTKLTPILCESFQAPEEDQPTQLQESFFFDSRGFGKSSTTSNNGNGSGSELSRPQSTKRTSRPGSTKHYREGSRRDKFISHQHSPPLRPQKLIQFRSKSPVVGITYQIHEDIEHEPDDYKLASTTIDDEKAMFDKFQKMNKER